MLPKEMKVQFRCKFDECSSLDARSAFLALYTDQAMGSVEGQNLTRYRVFDILVCASSFHEVLGIVREQKYRDGSPESKRRCDHPFKEVIQDSNEKEKEANIFMSNEKYFDAALLLSELIGAHPSNSTFRTRRSICFMALGHYERAREDAIEAIKLDAENLRAYQKLIEIYLAIGGRQEIENVIQKCNNVLEGEDTPGDEKHLPLRLKEKLEAYLIETKATNDKNEAVRLRNQK